MVSLSNPQKIKVSELNKISSKKILKINLQKELHVLNLKVLHIKKNYIFIGSMSSVAVHENKNDLSITIKKIFDQIDKVILKSKKSANNKSNDNVALDQSEKSKVILVEAPNVDSEIVICPVDSIVKNEQDENEKNKSNDSVALDQSEKSVSLVETPNVDAEIVICPVDSIGKHEQDENENNKSNDSVALDQISLVETPNVDAEIVICPVDSIVKHEQDENENNKSNVSVALDQSEKSKVSLVETPNVDAEIVICPVDNFVKNEQDENENKNCVTDLLRQATIISDSSDDESSPKNSKQFTFTDSDLPDSDEIKEILKSYPRPIVIEPLCIESESKSNSEDENDWFSRRHRRRNKNKLVTEVTIEKLPARFITRQRVPNIMLSDEISKKNCVRQLQSSYLKNQEDEMDAEIIQENIKRLKIIKEKINVNIAKPVKKGSKSKSCALNNTKKNTLDSRLANKRMTRATRSMKNKTDGKNIKNKCISSGVKKTDNKRKPTHKKDKSILPAVEGRRSKRHQKANMKEEDTMKAPEPIPASIPKKSMHKQSYNNSSSTSESPKSLKRSLVEDSDVQSPKRTRSFNNINNVPVPARSIMKAQKLQQKRRDNRKPAQQQAKGIKKLNSNRNYLNVKTRSQSARTRSQQGSKRTKD